MWFWSHFELYNLSALHWNMLFIIRNHYQWHNRSPSNSSILYSLSTYDINLYRNNSSSSFSSILHNLSIVRGHLSRNSYGCNHNSSNYGCYYSCYLFHHCCLDYSRRLYDCLPTIPSYRWNLCLLIIPNLRKIYFSLKTLVLQLGMNQSSLLIHFIILLHAKILNKIH